MKTKIQKWGNSLGVRLPKNITQLQSLETGSEVVISIVDEKIVIESTTRTPRQKLLALLEQITPANEYHEYDWGVAKGKEVW